MILVVRETMGLAAPPAFALNSESVVASNGMGAESRALDARGGCGMGLKKKQTAYIYEGSQSFDEIRSDARETQAAY